jgi:hypothetical protein
VDIISMGIDNIHLWMIKCFYQQIMTLKKFLQEFDMKRQTVLGKGIGIIALAALIGFLATACPEEDGGKKDNGGNNDNGDTGGASAFLGDSLDLSGQVYESSTDSNFLISYTEFNGNLSITAGNGGSGSISNGQFSYSIGVPTGLTTLDFSNAGVSSATHDNISFSKAGVKGLIINEFNITPGSSGQYSVSYKQTTTVQGSPYSITYEWVYYVYVEEDVTVSGTGKTTTVLGKQTNYGNLNLALKTGWNAVYRKQAESRPDANQAAGTVNATYSLSNPSLKWVLQ